MPARLTQAPQGSRVTRAAAEDLPPSPLRRVKRVSRDTEGPIHRAVYDYLRTSLPSGFIIHHAANKPRSAIQGGREKGLGAIKGWPDLAIYGPGPDGPSAWFAEIKAPGGHLSPEQRALHDRLMDAGFGVRVVRSIEDARKAVRDWRLPTNDMLIRDSHRARHA